jgi:hypothetical protein
VCDSFWSFSQAGISSVSLFESVDQVNHLESFFVPLLSTRTSLYVKVRDLSLINVTRKQKPKWNFLTLRTVNGKWLKQFDMRPKFLTTLSWTGTLGATTCGDLRVCTEQNVEHHIEALHWARWFQLHQIHSIIQPLQWPWHCYVTCPSKLLSADRCQDERQCASSSDKHAAQPITSKG